MEKSNNIQVEASTQFVRGCSITGPPDIMQKSGYTKSVLYRINSIGAVKRASRARISGTQRTLSACKSQQHRTLFQDDFSFSSVFVNVTYHVVSCRFQACVNEFTTFVRCFSIQQADRNEFKAVVFVHVIYATVFLFFSTISFCSRCAK